MPFIKVTRPEGAPRHNPWIAWIVSGFFCAGMGTGVFWSKYRPEVALQLAPWVIGFGFSSAVIASIMSARRRD